MLTNISRTSLTAPGKGIKRAASQSAASRRWSSTTNRETPVVPLQAQPAKVRLRSRTESSMAAAGGRPFAGIGRCTEFARDASVEKGFRSSYRLADRFGCLWSSHASHVLLKGSMTHLLRL